MADPLDPINGSAPPPDDDAEPISDLPYGQESMEVEEDDAPRRLASARLVVDSKVGSEAALREAMDPANQSLAEALRLSFKVLQVVILFLLILFLVSSCKTVGEDQGGVFTRWGKIVPLNRDKSLPLTPGLKWGMYPYPVGEFVLFQQTNRQTDVGGAFYPQTRGMTQDQLLERADVNNPLAPGRDGSLITRDGDLMHMKVAARYTIENPVKFVQTIDDADQSRDANRLVRLAIEEAAVFVGAQHSLDELTGRPDEAQSLIKQRAQQILDSMKCGIQLASVSVGDNVLPFAIQKIAGALSEAEQDVRTQIENAQKKANQTLIEMAGENYQQLVDLIDQYEAAVDTDDEAKADTILAAINERLDDKELSGKVAEIIGSARAYEDQIDATLGNEARRFESVLAAFQEHPEVVIMQQWMEAYSTVLKKPDAEIIYVPAGILAMQINLSGNAQVQDLRRKNTIDRMGRESDMKDRNPADPYISRASDITQDKEGRQLKRDSQGRLIAPGTGEKK